MAVFTSGVLDNFNRNNESPLSSAAGWRAGPFFNTPSFAGVLAVQSNIAANSGTATSGYSQLWNTQPGADCEAYLSLVGPFAAYQQGYLPARAQNPARAARSPTRSASCARARTTGRAPP